MAVSISRATVRAAALRSAVGALGSAFSGRLTSDRAASSDTSGLSIGSLDPARLASMPDARSHVEHAVSSANSLLFTIAAVLALVALVAAVVAGRPTRHRDA